MFIVKVIYFDKIDFDVDYRLIFHFYFFQRHSYFKESNERIRPLRNIIS